MLELAEEPVKRLGGVEVEGDFDVKVTQGLGIFKYLPGPLPTRRNIEVKKC